MLALCARRNPMSSAWRLPRFALHRSNFLPAPPEGMNWNPRVDIERENGHFKLTGEFPGISKDDLHVDVKDGLLTLRGEKKKDFDEEKDGCKYSERFFGSFERTFRLPPETPVDGIVAKLDQGVLTVTIPVPPEKEVKNIEVATV
ncbi:Hsp20/alpha crystallin family protein [Thermodesulfobacteriota bacterium]